MRKSNPCIIYTNSESYYSSSATQKLNPFTCRVFNRVRSHTQRTQSQQLCLARLTQPSRSESFRVFWWTIFNSITPFAQLPTVTGEWNWLPLLMWAFESRKGGDTRASLLLIYFWPHGLYNSTTYQQHASYACMKGCIHSTSFKNFS